MKRKEPWPVVVYSASTTKLATRTPISCLNRTTVVIYYTKRSDQSAPLLFHVSPTTYSLLLNTERIGGSGYSIEAYFKKRTRLLSWTMYRIRLDYRLIERKTQLSPLNNCEVTERGQDITGQS
jgi:hypothetical protein